MYVNHNYTNSLKNYLIYYYGTFRIIIFKIPPTQILVSKMYLEYFSNTWKAEK